MPGNSIVSVATLERACASAGAVLAGVRQEQLDGTTPCGEWRVRDLVDHIAGAARFFGDLAEWGASPENQDGPVYSGGDFGASFREQAGRLVAGFSAPGAMERTMALPTGPAPGGQVIEVVTGEMFVHGWDLARATGHAEPADQAVAAALLASHWPALCEQVRPGPPPVFAPAVTVPATAAPADRLVALLGRDPHWSDG
ncbi:MAG TPA: TIGR03086 family metal-binding protein [Streptosporangiaceae bacterium]|nr:TIGR03086 family metal-binding protein [Streptosporangiaceae bacterium]